MREAELRAKRRRPYRCTTQADPTHSVAPNILARDFRPSRPDQAWASDITYLPTSEGWLYLAVVLDLFSRRVIGWSIGVRMTQRLALDALQMALGRRRTAPGLIHHSDRGSQYTAAAHRRLLTSRGIVCSMSRRGNCWDNAVAESFFATLETELLVDLRGRNREEVEQEVFRYVEGYYNRRRLLDPGLPDPGRVRGSVPPGGGYPATHEHLRGHSGLTQSEVPGKPGPVHSCASSSSAFANPGHAWLGPFGHIGGLGLQGSARIDP